jgi:segregation and condensation protein B
MLFAAHESLPSRRIARAIGYVTEQRIADAIAGLARRYDAQRSPLMLAEIAGGWRLVTRPEYAPFLARLFSKAEKERLSQAALETLAIIAYRQPATRAEVEAVRGVLVGPVLRLLQEKRLIKVTGRAEVVGRALQYGTTRRFLDHFGLASIEDLQVSERRRARTASPRGAPADPPGTADGTSEANGRSGRTGPLATNGPPPRGRRRARTCPPARPDPFCLPPAGPGPRLAARAGRTPAALSRRSRRARQSPAPARPTDPWPSHSTATARPTC